MEEQISHISQICFLNLRNLQRIGSRLTQDLKIQLVHSNILSILDYCNSSYAGITERLLHKLQKIQNNAVRFIFKLRGKEKWKSISPYLKKVHFLPIAYRIKFKVALMVFKCLNNLAPKYLKDLISLRDVKRISVRMDNDFYILKTPPPAKFSKTEAAFSYHGPKIWNSLPYNIRCIMDIVRFKKCLKTYLFDMAFENVS